jgi:hypothetical protein
VAGRYEAAVKLAAIREFTTRPLVVAAEVSQTLRELSELATKRFIAFAAFDDPARRR